MQERARLAQDARQTRYLCPSSSRHCPVRLTSPPSLSGWPATRRHAHRQGSSAGQPAQLPAPLVLSSSGVPA
eukprot:97822-Chlamydomonas_euryale.AAC.1